MCATGSLKLQKGPGACFECASTRFSMCVCNAMSRAYAGSLAAPSSESQLLQLLQATVPQQGTRRFFSVCAEAPRASSTKYYYSGMDCNCFGWAEDGYDAASISWDALSVLQVFNPDSPWRDIPCYQRLADDGGEWRHPVDNTTCRGVSDRLLANHMLCDWQYAGYCCECHGLDAQFHSNPASPWFDEPHSNASVSVPPQEVVQDGSGPDHAAAAVLLISRLADSHNVAWVRIDLQYSAAVIREVRIEFDNSNITIPALWQALKHFEVQIGDVAELDVNTVRAAYQDGDELKQHCRDCQPQLVSVDPDLLMWLRFDDPIFVCKDSSNYRADAQVMKQTAAGLAEPVMHQPLIASGAVPPLWGDGSLILTDSHYLQLGSITLQPESDLSISFWFLGMPHPTGEQRHVLLESSTPDATSSIRFEQNYRHPDGLTIILMMEGVSALQATNQPMLGHHISSSPGAAVSVGQWNHALLVINTGENRTNFCLNAQCLLMQDGVQATDGNTYSVRGIHTSIPLVLSSHIIGAGDVDGNLCPRVPSATFVCYEGQMDEIRFYQRALTDDTMQHLSHVPPPELSLSSAHMVIWQAPVAAYIPWTGTNLVLQLDVSGARGRYIFIRLPVCSRALTGCNTLHTISIAHLHVDRQKWHFDAASAWSWSGDSMPDTLTQEPWLGGAGLCFKHHTALFSHREAMGLPRFSLEMDLKTVKALSGLVFAPVPHSAHFGMVRVHYDVEPYFSAGLFQTTDLSHLSVQNHNISTEMFFDDGPVRARYVRIVLQEYPGNPPCIAVAPILCDYRCEGCCQSVQTVDLTALPPLQAAVDAAPPDTDAVVGVWHTGHNKCACSQQHAITNRPGVVVERVFSTYHLGNLSFFECHETKHTPLDAYDNRHMTYTLALRVPYASGHRALVSDSIIDFADPREPVLLRQGVTTSIDWSNSVNANNPVFIANQGNTKTMYTGSANGDITVTVDMATRRTSILVTDSAVAFATMTLFYFYDTAAVSKPVAFTLVDMVHTPPSLRPDLFCSVHNEYAQVHTLCPCNYSGGFTDPFGVPLLQASVLPLDRSRIVSQKPLPARFTHILQPNGGETLYDGDHIFATRPSPPTQGALFRPEMSMARVEADGEFLQTDSTRAVFVNRFGVLDNVAVLYKDISNMEDPYLCRDNRSSPVCGGQWVADTASDAVIALLHTRRTLAKNRWRAIELQTEESHFGPGGAGFVQRLHMGEEWHADTAIHLTPHIGMSLTEGAAAADWTSTGKAVHMSVFVTSKKLDISPGSTEWDWIRCGAMTHTPVTFPPAYMSASIVLAEQYWHGPDRLVNSADTTAIPKLTPSLGDVFFTAFASADLWKSQGGFLPDPPMCWHGASDTSQDSVSAQAPLGGIFVTHPENPACRLGQMTFPGRGNAAIHAGYVRCDLSKNLNTEQVLPCMYTLGDVMIRYGITDADLQQAESLKSVYQIQVPPHDAAAVTNKRGDDPFTQKVAHGSRQNTHSQGMPLFVCHPQYNNLPLLLESDTTVLRPDIACSIPQNGISSALLVDCVCGIIAKTFTKGDTDVHAAKIVRIIPRTVLGQGTPAVPSHGFITEMAVAALAVGDVLSIGTMTQRNDSGGFVPLVYFASDPTTAGMHVTISSLPAQYDICAAQKDPDNENSTNHRNPHILDGIVVPLGVSAASGTYEHDCCNFIRPHTQVFALDSTNATQSRIAFVPGGSRVGNTVPSPFWNTVPAQCVAPQLTSPTWSSDTDINDYPCSVTVVASTSAATTTLLESSWSTPGADSVHIFDKVYVKKRGWLVVLFSSTRRRMCTADPAFTQPCASAYSDLHDWQVMHVRAASSTHDYTQNYNIPNDAHLWSLGEALFGGAAGVGSCAQRCPSSGQYDNIMGTIRWKPNIPVPAASHPATEYWLYTVFSVGDSLACQLYNCDEARFSQHRAQVHTDTIPNANGVRPITLLEGTRITAFLPDSTIVGAMDPGCITESGNNTDNATTNAWHTFRMSAALFGTQRVTDFAFCVACVHATCHNNVVTPCRWQSLVDATWWYYMDLYLPGANASEPAVQFQFRVMSPKVQDSEYTEHTDFIGHYNAASHQQVQDVGAVIGFTTPDRQCAHAVPVAVVSAGMRRYKRRIHATTTTAQALRANHGRQQHFRLHPAQRHNSPGYAAVSLQGTHSDNSVASKSSSGDTPTRSASASGARRFLLSLHAPSRSAVDLENTTQNNAMLRSITSINSNQRVAAAVCAQKHRINNTCDTVVAQKQFLINIFCLNESAFMELVVPAIRLELLQASSANVSDIVVASVARANFENKCARMATRRLLQQEFVHFTYVTVVSMPSFVNVELLVSRGYSGVRHLTNSPGSQLHLCRSSHRIRSTSNPYDAAHFCHTRAPVAVNAMQSSHMHLVQNDVSASSHTESEFINSLFSHSTLLIGAIVAVSAAVAAFIFFGWCWDCRARPRKRIYQYSAVLQDDVPQQQRLRRRPRFDWQHPL